MKSLISSGGSIALRLGGSALLGGSHSLNVGGCTSCGALATGGLY